MNITKLVSAVLKTEAVWVEMRGNTLYYNTDNHKSSCFKMNVYEFAHLCKMWANDNYDVVIWVGRAFTKINIHPNWYDMKPFRCVKEDSTNTSGVFKACLWLQDSEEWNQC